MKKTIVTFLCAAIIPSAFAAADHETDRFDLAFDSAKAIRQVMREPASLQWISIGVNNDGTVACLTYRARNGFGGMNIERAVVFNSKASSKKRDWERHCNMPLRDYTAAGT